MPDVGVIGFSRPDIGPEEIAAVTDVLESGLLAGGRRVAELEARWSEFIGTKHAIAVSSGTAAEMCIFAGLGLGPGDEVITVGYTFNATVSSISSTGATPVFVDIERDTYVIDASLIEAAITPRTRAICPVHLFGLPADLDTIIAIADRHGLSVVEDACQAHGAAFHGRRVGSFGHGAFSLYGTKNMTTGEGGLITTNDDELADWIRLYRNQGMRERHHHEILGYNFRLTDIAAAIGLCQLDKLERNAARRQAIAARYEAAFADLPILTPVAPVGRSHVFHQYTIAVSDQRDDIVADLAAAGVSSAAHYRVPVHRQPYVVERGIQANLPITDRAALETLSLPMFPGLTDGDQTTVIAAVRAAVERRAPGWPASVNGPVPGGRGSMRVAWSPVGARELRVGLIGLGSMGRNHQRVLGGLPGVRLAAVADPDADARTAATAGSDARGFAEPMAMLSDADLDAVVIASPTTSHMQLTLGALDLGIAVLVEKPLAATLAEADRIVAAASVVGAPPVQVGHIERFNPAVIELERLLKAGWLSKVIAISSQRVGPFPARTRDVGVTVDLATHDVDILCAIAGERPARVSAEAARNSHAEHEDLLFGLMSFPSGIVARLDVDGLTPATRRRLTVLGEEGVFELDYLAQRLTFARATNTMRSSPDRRPCDGVRRRPARTARRDRRATRRRTRGIRAGRPRRWPAPCGRDGRPLGGRARRRAPHVRSGAPDGRTGARVSPSSGPQRSASRPGACQRPVAAAGRHTQP